MRYARLSPSLARRRRSDPEIGKEAARTRSGDLGLASAALDNRRVPSAVTPPRRGDLGLASATDEDGRVPSVVTETRSGRPSSLSTFTTAGDCTSKAVPF